MPNPGQQNIENNELIIDENDIENNANNDNQEENDDNNLAENVDEKVFFEIEDTEADIIQAQLENQEENNNDNYEDDQGSNSNQDDDLEEEKITLKIVDPLTVNKIPLDSNFSIQSISTNNAVIKDDTIENWSSKNFNSAEYRTMYNSLNAIQQLVFRAKYVALNDGDNTCLDDPKIWDNDEAIMLLETISSDNDKLCNDFEEYYIQNCQLPDEDLDITDFTEEERQAKQNEEKEKERANAELLFDIAKVLDVYVSVDNHKSIITDRINGLSKISDVGKDYIEASETSFDLLENIFAPNANSGARDLSTSYIGINPKTKNNQYIASPDKQFIENKEVMGKISLKGLQSQTNLSDEAIGAIVAGCYFRPDVLGETYKQTFDKFENAINPLKPNTRLSEFDNMVDTFFKYTTNGDKRRSANISLLAVPKARQMAHYALTDLTQLSDRRAVVEALENVVRVAGKYAFTHPENDQAFYAASKLVNDAMITLDMPQFREISTLSPKERNVARSVSNMYLANTDLIKLNYELNEAIISYYRDHANDLSEQVKVSPLTDPSIKRVFDSIYVRRHYVESHFNMTKQYAKEGKMRPLTSEELTCALNPTKYFDFLIKGKQFKDGVKWEGNTSVVKVPHSLSSANNLTDFADAYVKFSNEPIPGANIHTISSEEYNRSANNLRENLFSNHDLQYCIRNSSSLENALKIVGKSVQPISSDLLSNFEVELRKKNIETLQGYLKIDSDYQTPFAQLVLGSLLKDPSNTNPEIKKIKPPYTKEHFNFRARRFLFDPAGRQPGNVFRIKETLNEFNTQLSKLYAQLDNVSRSRKQEVDFIENSLDDPEDPLGPDIKAQFKKKGIDGISKSAMISKSYTAGQSMGLSELLINLQEQYKSSPKSLIVKRSKKITKDTVLQKITNDAASRSTRVSKQSKQSRAVQSIRSFVSTRSGMSSISKASNMYSINMDDLEVEQKNLELELNNDLSQRDIQSINTSKIALQNLKKQEIVDKKKSPKKGPSTNWGAKLPEKLDKTQQLDKIATLSNSAIVQMRGKSTKKQEQEYQHALETKLRVDTTQLTKAIEEKYGFKPIKISGPRKQKEANLDVQEEDYNLDRLFETEEEKQQRILEEKEKQDEIDDFLNDSDNEIFPYSGEIPKDEAKVPENGLGIIPEASEYDEEDINDNYEVNKEDPLSQMGSAAFNHAMEQLSNPQMIERLEKLGKVYNPGIQYVLKNMNALHNRYINTQTTYNDIKDQLVDMGIKYVPSTDYVTMRLFRTVIYNSDEYIANPSLFNIGNEIDSIQKELDTLQKNGELFSPDENVINSTFKIETKAEEEVRQNNEKLELKKQVEELKKTLEAARPLGGKLYQKTLNLGIKALDDMIGNYASFGNQVYTPTLSQNLTFNQIIPATVDEGKKTIRHASRRLVDIQHAINLVVENANKKDNELFDYENDKMRLEEKRKIDLELLDKIDNAPNQGEDMAIRLFKQTFDSMPKNMNLILNGDEKNPGKVQKVTDHIKAIKDAEEQRIRKEAEEKAAKEKEELERIEKEERDFAKLEKNTNDYAKNNKDQLIKQIKAQKYISTIVQKQLSTKVIDYAENLRNLNNTVLKNCDKLLDALNKDQPIYNLLVDKNREYTSLYAEMRLFNNNITFEMGKDGPAFKYTKEKPVLNLRDANALMPVNAEKITRLIPPFAKNIPTEEYAKEYDRIVWESSPEYKELQIAKENIAKLKSYQPEGTINDISAKLTLLKTALDKHVKDNGVSTATQLASAGSQVIGRILENMDPNNPKPIFATLIDTNTSKLSKDGAILSAVLDVYQLSESSQILSLEVSQEGRNKRQKLLSQGVKDEFLDFTIPKAEEFENKLFTKSLDVQYENDKQEKARQAAIEEKLNTVISSDNDIDDLQNIVIENDKKIMQNLVSYNLAFNELLEQNQIPKAVENLAKMGKQACEDMIMKFTTDGKISVDQIINKGQSITFSDNLAIIRYAQNTFIFDNDGVPHINPSLDTSADDALNPEQLKEKILSENKENITFRTIDKCLSFKENAAYIDDDMLEAVTLDIETKARFKELANENINSDLVDTSGITVSEYNKNSQTPLANSFKEFRQSLIDTNKWYHKNTQLFKDVITSFDGIINKLDNINDDKTLKESDLISDYVKLQQSCNNYLTARKSDKFHTTMGKDRYRIIGEANKVIEKRIEKVCITMCKKEIAKQFAEQAFFSIHDKNEKPTAGELATLTKKVVASPVYNSIVKDKSLTQLYHIAGNTDVLKANIRKYTAEHKQENNLHKQNADVSKDLPKQQVPNV